MYHVPQPEVTELFGEDGIKQWNLAVKLQEFPLEKPVQREYNISYAEETDLWRDVIR